MSIDNGTNDTDDSYRSCQQSYSMMLRASSQDPLSSSLYASWDACARAWILTADEAKRFEQTQLKLITRNVGLPVNTSSSTYRNVIESWTVAMTSLDKLVSGMPQSISKGATLLGLSAWHIFPDLNVVGQTAVAVKFKDPLVAPGGMITVDPVSIVRSSGTDGTRVSLKELHLIAFGSLLAHWPGFGHDPLGVAQFILSLWKCMQPQAPRGKRKRTTEAEKTSRTVPNRFENRLEPQKSSLRWMLPLVEASMDLLGAPAGQAKENALMLIALGRRRGRSFLTDGISGQLPLFGLSNVIACLSFSNELQVCREERAIAILRDIATRLNFRNDESVIRYRRNMGGYGWGTENIEYATAIPLPPDHHQNAGQVPSEELEKYGTHQRWIAKAELDAIELVHKIKPAHPQNIKDATTSILVKDVEGKDVDRHQARDAASLLGALGAPDAGLEGMADVMGDEDVVASSASEVDSIRRLILRQGEICSFYRYPGPESSADTRTWIWRSPPSSFRTSKYARTAKAKEPEVLDNFQFGKEYEFFEDAMKARSEELPVEVAYGYDEDYENVAIFHIVAGDGATAALLHCGSDPPTSVNNDLDAVIDFFNSPYVKVNELVEHMMGIGSTQTYVKPLFALDLISSLHRSVHGGSIPTSLIYKPLSQSKWILEQQPGSMDIPTDNSDCEDDPVGGGLSGALPYHVDSYGAKFACIAMLELGAGCNIDPRGIKSVMAMSTGNSIYVALPLQQDPYERDRGHGLRRIIGNVGRPGITMLVPPQIPRIRRPSDSWKLIQHATYDGQVQDCFPNTTLHLSFTKSELRLSVGVSGGVDFEVTLVESLVSVHDHGKWVADLDILGSLSKALFRRGPCSPCIHSTKKVRKSDSYSRITSIDNWDELIDSPENLGGRNMGVIKASKNWQGRLAATVISIQKGYRTCVLQQPPVCDVCINGPVTKKLEFSDKSLQLCVL